MATRERSAAEWLAGLDTEMLRRINAEMAAEDAADAAAEARARRGHCLACGGWCAPDADGFCYSCAVHPVEAPVTWQVVGMHRRTRVLRVMADELSREDAEETRRRAMDDKLTEGWAIFLEKDGDPNKF